MWICSCHVCLSLERLLFLQMPAAGDKPGTLHIRTSESASTHIGKVLMSHESRGASSELLLSSSSPQRSQLSPARWFCLAVTTAIAALEGACWAHFGPISPVIKPFFSWDDSQLALLANWGPICFLIGVAPTASVLQSCGLRPACIIACALVFSGSVLRCVHVSGDGWGSLLMHAGQFINGLAGPVAMSAGPVLSATWFAPCERTTATAIVGVSNYGGVALSFLLGPLLVPDDPKQTSDQVAHNLRKYMLVEAGVALLLLLGAIAMPTQPPSAPAPSASVSRAALRQSIPKLLRMPQFWACAVSYGMVNGFFQSWGAMLGPMMGAVLPADKAEEQGGWIGFWGAIAGIPGGICLSMLADRMHGRKKALLLLSCALAAASFVAFAVVCSPLGLEPSLQTSLLLLTSIAGSLFANAVVPLYFELAVEATFPLSEGVVTCVLTLVNNVACFAFLLAEDLPGIGTAWMSWALAAACAAGFVLLLPVHEEQRRLAFDIGEDTVGAGQSNPASFVTDSVEPI